MSAAGAGTARRPKVDQHETATQVGEHERFVKRYRAAGLCTRCAAQAGYGHQLGFTKVHPPCSTCSPLVAAFPIPKAGAWRAVIARGRGRGVKVGSGVSPASGRGIGSPPDQRADVAATVAA